MPTVQKRFLVLVIGLVAACAQWGIGQSEGAQEQHPPAMKYTLEAITTQNVTYPEKARKKKLEGRIIATFEISESGDVAGVWVSGFDVDLIHAMEEAVKDAVSKWKFKPVIQDGSPIRVFGKAMFRFDLRDAAQRANGVHGDIIGGMDIPKSTRVSNGVMEKLLVKKVDPVYPEDAKRNHVRGVVMLAVTIDREGAVTTVQPVSGPPELVPAAVDALKQWRYKPFLMWGRPLEVHTQIQVNFPK